MASLNTSYGRDASLLGGSTAVTSSRSSVVCALDVALDHRSVKTSASFVSAMRRRHCFGTCSEEMTSSASSQTAAAVPSDLVLVDVHR